MSLYQIAATPKQFTAALNRASTRSRALYAVAKVREYSQALEAVKIARQGGDLEAWESAVDTALRAQKRARIALAA